uniref:Uncharacterized protein n=1 Tax=Arundo donax TaxID=35708 RepID=A0A0A9C302_ARUDO
MSPLTSSIASLPKPLVVTPHSLHHTASFPHTLTFASLATNAIPICPPPHLTNYPLVHLCVFSSCIPRIIRDIGALTFLPIVSCYL